jgi:hypothetical protein
MDSHASHLRAVQKIRAARDAIVRIAAEWQRSGTETTALSQPLVDIQEALAELEALEAARPKAPPPPHAPRINTLTPPAPPPPGR